MSKPKIWRKFYECDCGDEGIMMGYEFYDDIEKKFPLIDLAFFGHGYGGHFPLSLKDKIRWCWNIIRTGYPFIDGVILSQKRAKELGTDLLKFANKNFK